MPFVTTWMELETLILSELSQKGKNKYHMISLLSGIQYMAQMNPSTDKNLLYLENRIVVVKGEWEGVGGTRSLELVDANYYT